jgi:hypothetical protein
MSERTPASRAGGDRAARPLVRVRTPEAEDASIIPLSTASAWMNSPTPLRKDRAAAGPGAARRTPSPNSTPASPGSGSGSTGATWTRTRTRPSGPGCKAQRKELVGQAAERKRSPLPLGSLMEGWATGDPRTRRALLAVFFDEIDIVDQEIVSVVPRKEHAAEVVALLDRLDDQYRGRSPGGIRGDVQSIPPLVPILRSA